MEDEPVANSRASRLLQQGTSPDRKASPEATQQLREVYEAREKLVNIVQVSLLDFKRQSPTKVKACVEVLLRLQQSILENPANEKFRKVKESSRVFSANIAPFKAASDFLSTAGWRLKTIDFEAHWVCEAQADTVPWRILKEAESVLTESLVFLEQKAEKYSKEKATTKEKQAAERDRVRSAIKDDKQMRKFTQETRVPLPMPPPRSHEELQAARQPRRRPGMAPQQLSLQPQDEPEDDELHDNLSDTQNEED